MYSIKQELNNLLKRLIQFLVNREYEEDHVDSKIQKSKIGKENCFVSKTR